MPQSKKLGVTTGTGYKIDLAMTNLSPALRKHLISDLPSADTVLPYLRRIDEARWYTNFGALATELEQYFVDLFNRGDQTPQHGPTAVTTVCNGHIGLEIALRMLGIKPGDRVIVPALTFPACPLAVQHAGATPILADVDADQWILTPAIARRIAARMPIAAVMPVAVYGVPIETVAWDQFTQETGIPVVIDAAAAIETQHIPAHGIVVHSMHATKPFGVGEGGLIVCRDAQMISNIRMHENFGTDLRIAYTDGTNGKMSEYHAAVGLAQAARWESIKQSRRQILALYRKQLAPLAGDVTFQPGLDKAVPSILMLNLSKPIALDISQRMQATGLAMHRTYLPPLYAHPYFSALPVSSIAADIPAHSDDDTKQNTMIASESLLHHLIGVPFHPFMTEEDVAIVVSQLTEALRS